jgi:hypothetical protein
VSPTAFGWWAIGIAAGGVATLIVARFLKVRPDGFLRREVPLAVLVIPVLLIAYVGRSFQWSNTLLNSRAFGSPDSTLRTVQSIILAPENAARDLRGPTIMTALLAALAFFFASTPEQREKNRQSRGRGWLAFAIFLVGMMVEVSIIW